MRRLAILVGLGLTARLAAVDLQPLVHLDLRGGMVGVEGQDATPLVQGEFFAVPAVQFSQRTSLLPSLYFVGGGQERSLEEAALFVRTAALGFRPQVKERLDGGSVLTFTGEMRHAYNVEAVNESVGLGLYDYEEYAAGLAWDSTVAGVPAGFGARMDHRSYPNYHLLSADVNPGGAGYYFHDFVGTQGEVHADLGPVGRLAASVEQRNYPDGYVISDVDGTAELGQNQQDLLEDLSLRGFRDPAGDGRLGLGWSLDWQASQSNQNVFDDKAHDASGTNVPVGMSHGLDYSAVSLAVSAQWRPQQTWSLLGSYTANLRNFNRLLQNQDGTYTQGTIAEVEHDVSLGFRWPLAYNLAAVAGVDAQYLLSNQEYAAAGVPSYNYYGGNLGLQWDWKPAR